LGTVDYDAFVVGYLQHIKFRLTVGAVKNLGDGIDMTRPVKLHGVREFVVRKHEFCGQLDPRDFVIELWCKNTGNRIYFVDFPLPDDVTAQVAGYPVMHPLEQHGENSEGECQSPGHPEWNFPC
jgi:hypothetical protein